MCKLYWYLFQIRRKSPAIFGISIILNPQPNIGIYIGILTHNPCISMILILLYNLTILFRQFDGISNLFTIIKYINDAIIVSSCIALNVLQRSKAMLARLFLRLIQAIAN